MTYLLAGMIGIVVGAGVFAAGAYFRHRVIRPEPPVCVPREGNAWIPETGREKRS